MSQAGDQDLQEAALAIERKNLLIRRIARPSDLVTRCLLLLTRGRVSVPLVSVDPIVIVLPSKSGILSGSSPAREADRRSRSRIRVADVEEEETESCSVLSPTTSRLQSRSIRATGCRQLGHVSKVSIQRIRIS